MNARPANRMTRGARAITLVAALLLGMLYVTPLWSVRLVAPQYPEGLGMHIRLNTIEGMKEFDLRNINALNHYIGMKPIEPQAIPELTYMPWIVAALIGAGLLVVALGRRRLLVGWAAAFAILSAAGMYDFWRWSYDYGHNLDIENAVIVVPGMTYQPPLIGTKQVLNFTATSLPASGGIIAGIAFALALAAVVLTYRRASGRAAMVGTALVAAACAGASPTIALGVDACVECRMLISDGRFGAALVTRTGMTLRFDSLNCLLEYLRDNPGASRGSVWIASASGATALFPAELGTFVRQGTLRPPMGDVVAFANAEAADSAKGANGTTLSWPELRDAH
ncbi:MAG: hypothetical protein WD825_14000 [Gemmatimonadaceae bacterium]